MVGAMGVDRCRWRVNGTYLDWAIEQMPSRLCRRWTIMPTRILQSLAIIPCFRSALEMDCSCFSASSKELPPNVSISSFANQFNLIQLEDQFHQNQINLIFFHILFYFTWNFLGIVFRAVLILFAISKWLNVSADQFIAEINYTLWVGQFSLN